MSYRGGWLLRLRAINQCIAGQVEFQLSTQSCDPPLPYQPPLPPVKRSAIPPPLYVSPSLPGDIIWLSHSIQKTMPPCLLEREPLPSFLPKETPSLLPSEKGSPLLYLFTCPSPWRRTISKLSPSILWQWPPAYCKETPSLLPSEKRTSPPLPLKETPPPTSSKRGHLSLTSQCASPSCCQDIPRSW